MSSPESPRNQPPRGSPLPTQAPSSGASPASPPPPAEPVAGRFQLEALAGTGAMGTVWRARDLETQAVVAVKVVQPTGRDAARFHREVDALRQLDHPAIVRHVAHGTRSDGALWLAMEWLDGEDLAARLSRGPLTVDETLRLGVRVCVALGAAHARRIVHRDVKPTNIFLPGGALEAAKVLDFGIARVPGSSQTVTSSGDLLGTPAYMSPEQARGERRLDPRTDVFALGSVLYECATGQPPFAGEHLVGILAKLLFEEPPRPLAPGGVPLPPPLEALLLRMLAKNRDDRPADASVVAEALEAMRSPAAASAARASAPGARAAGAARTVLAHPAPAGGAATMPSGSGSSTPSGDPPGDPSGDPPEAPAAPDDHDRLIGTTLGSYRIVGKLGAGGMGTVYAAQHIAIGRKAAIKMLHPERASQPAMIQRFFNEARASNRVSHPGIVDVYDVGEAPGIGAYLVMELLEGQSLDHYLDARRRLPPAEVAYLVDRLASALGAAHARGIVHRDLKPANVFLVPDPDRPGEPFVKILDFGIAKLRDDVDGASGPTRSGQVLGTPMYMSPEQCHGARDVDARSDVYSLGIIAFEALCGRPPFMGSGYGELLALHLGQPAPSPRSFEPSVPAALEAVVLKALEKAPANRFASMDELGAAWARALGRASRAEAAAAAATASSPGLVPAPFDGRAAGLAETTPFSFGDSHGRAGTITGGASEMRTLPRRRTAVGLAVGGTALALLAGISVYAIGSRDPAVSTGSGSLTGAAGASGLATGERTSPLTASVTPVISTAAPAWTGASEPDPAGGTVSASTAAASASAAAASATLTAAPVRTAAPGKKARKGTAAPRPKGTGRPATAGSTPAPSAAPYDPPIRD